MTPNDYQLAATHTARTREGYNLSDHQITLLWGAIGVAGEAGEIAELAKKQIFHQHGIDANQWKKELGDVLWYIAACCTTLGITMEDVMQANIDKLKARFPDGWDAARTTAEHKQGDAK